MVEVCIPCPEPRRSSNDGTGLQCHTAPYSWKLVFICDHQLYEVILTACTPKEEMEWRSRLGCQQDISGQDLMQPAAFSFLALNTKSLGTVFRKPGMTELHFVKGSKPLTFCSRNHCQEDIDTQGNYRWT